MTIFTLELLATRSVSYEEWAVQVQWEWQFLVIEGPVDLLL